MSELAALEPFGDFHSALYFRDLFLRDETIYDEFFCPFCGVPLNQVLVYAPIDQELGKSPHFRTQPRGPKHYSGCDGNPSNYQHPSEKKLSKRTSKSADLHCQRNFLNILIARINLMDSSPSPLQLRTKSYADEKLQGVGIVWQGFAYHSSNRWRKLTLPFWQRLIR